jgi:hypothetical protein
MRKLPRFFIEGGAEYFSFSRECDPDAGPYATRPDCPWRSVDAVLAGRTFDAVAGPAGVGPFTSPYLIGGLLFRWLRETYGDGVDQAILNGMVNSACNDPIQCATGAPEPLAIAMMYASLYFDGTSFGHEHGLEFGDDHVGARLRHGAPVRTIQPEARRRDTCVYTGHIAYELAHGTPVHVKLRTNAFDHAYVLVLQP